MTAGFFSYILDEKRNGGFKSDKMDHCVAACNMARACGPFCGYMMGYLKESTDSTWDGDDIKANESGEKCAWGLSDCGPTSCLECCKQSLPAGDNR